MAQNTGDFWLMHSPEVAAGAVDDEADRALDLGVEHVVGAEQAAARQLGVDDLDLVRRAHLVAALPQSVRRALAVRPLLVLAVVEFLVAHARDRVVDDAVLGGGGDAGEEDARKQRAQPRVHLVGVHVAQRVERVGDVGRAHPAQDFESLRADGHCSFSLAFPEEPLVSHARSRQDTSVCGAAL